MSVGGTCAGGYCWELLIKFDVQILETMFDIVLKFHDQTLSVVEVITIPVIILKRHAAYVFIGRSNNNSAMISTPMLLLLFIYIIIYTIFIVSPIKQHAACCFRIITGS